MVITGLTQEQLALLTLAQQTWGRRGQAKTLRSPYGEETITQTMLMDLQATYPGRVTVTQFSKAQEANNGADWAWVFQDNSGQHAFTMLVQAKLLDVADRDYPEIKRRVGKSTDRQIDRLIAHAAQLGVPPVYAFYNHLTNPLRIPDACGTLRQQGLNIPPSWGISFANAHDVRAALDDQSFDTHARHSRPLHCLLCSGGTGEHAAGGGSAAQARRALDPNGEASARFDAERGLFAEALLLSQLGDGPMKQFRVDRIAQEFPDLAGVVVLRDAEEREEDRGHGEMLSG